MKLIILPGGDLKITMDNQERSYMAEKCRQSYDAAEGHMAECLHEAYNFVLPEAIGALTSAPILCASDDLDWSDYPEHTHMPVPFPDAKVFWFPGYMLQDPWEELAHKGRVVFTAAA